MTRQCDSHRVFWISNVSFNRDHSIIYIKLKASTTDPFRVGVIIRIAAAIRNHKLCPVVGRAFLFVSPPGPLFVFSNGYYFTHRFVVPHS